MPTPNQNIACIQSRMFILTFDQFNTFLLEKSINLFQKTKQS